MATRAVIGVYTDQKAGQWRGVYHHWDGYPNGLGRSLWHLYQQHYKGLLPAMIEMLIDAHPHGWSTIVDADWSQRPTWLNPVDPRNPRKLLPPLSYKYRGGEKPWPFDQTTDGGQEWAYVFDLERNTMTIFERVGSWETLTYARIETLPLDGSEPDWSDFD